MANGKESDPALSTIAPEAPVTSERPVDVYKLGIPYPRMFIFFFFFGKPIVLFALSSLPAAVHDQGNIGVSVAF
jgi:hypothetical protein